MVNKSQKKIFFGISLVILVILVTAHKPNDTSNKDINAKKHVMTIFIHGTILPTPSFAALDKTMEKKTTSETLTSGALKKLNIYQKYLKHLRTESFYKYQVIDDIGLVKINPSDQNQKTKPKNQLVNLYKSIQQDIKTNPNTSFSYYAFGWLGQLSQKKRTFASEQFYKELTDEINKIKKELNINDVDVEILAHSHGGNVALLLAEADKKFKQNLTIQKFVLFGTPIQSETSHLINSNIFKKVYNFYSKGDAIQVIDIFSTQDPYSKRRFKNNASKLTQIEIHVNKAEPRHTELWFLSGKDNLLYRSNFPIYPLPIVVFSPLITHFIESNLETANNINLKIVKNTEQLEFNFAKNDLSITNKSSENFTITTNFQKLINQIEII